MAKVTHRAQRARANPRPAADLEERRKAQLETTARRLGIYDQIEGSGADGNVLKEDLVEALRTD